MRRHFILGVLLLLAITSVTASASAADFTADRHMTAGLTCESCHGTAQTVEGAEVSMDQCLTCHGPYDTLAKRTAELKHNPHGGHYPDLDCNTCHHGHRADENYCSSCHSA